MVAPSFMSSGTVTDAGPDRETDVGEGGSARAVPTTAIAAAIAIAHDTVAAALRDHSSPLAMILPIPRSQPRAPCPVRQ